MWGFLAGLIPHIRSGSLRALAVGSRERSSVLPDTPTVAEAGVPGYEAASWIGLLAPAATPPPLIDRLWGALARAMATPAVKDVLLRDGSDIVMSKPDVFRAAMESDYAKYGKLRDLLKGAQ
jgi:tripartite-type tricarboxylate transporter receptor subunit TctC